MIKVGITGGIGSGKSSACHIFELLNIPVYNADNRAKWLMNNDLVLQKNIKAIFGKDIYHEDGLDRKKLASLVFTNKDLLKELNDLVHPAVKLDSLSWFQNQKNVPFAIKEAALIFEVGGENQLDKVITVFAPADVRIKRVMKRDQVDTDAVRSRMKNQMDDMEKVSRSDYVIINDGNHSLINQVLSIYHKLKAINQSILKQIE